MTPTTTAAATPTTVPGDILAASRKWNVPLNILVGVFGVETGFGSNVNTSSAGAQGYMQFIKGTAATYGYPMTNTPTAAERAQQFDSAAHLLHDSFVKYGSWDSAIQNGYGGGYGLAAVNAQAVSSTGAALIKAIVTGADFTNIPGATPAGVLAGPISTVGSLLSAAGNTASSIGDIVSFITSASNWLRLGEVLLGGLLLLFGLRALAGADNLTTQVVRRVR